MNIVGRSYTLITSESEMVELTFVVDNSETLPTRNMPNTSSLVLRARQ